MISAELLKEWINGLSNDDEVAIDDGGLMLLTKDGQCYIEVGGLPNASSPHAGDEVSYQGCLWEVLWSDGVNLQLRSRGGREVILLTVEALQKDNA